MENSTMKIKLPKMFRGKDVPLRVLICGDRDWEDGYLIEQYIKAMDLDTTIIHGACRGADLMAEEAAKKFQRDYMGFPARWGTDGKPAGPIRNSHMLRVAKPQIVLAFHDDIENSKGTKDMVTKARAAGIPVEIISG
jgi:hypothetical protein